MIRALGLLLIGVSVVFALLGLLFLVGSAGELRRIIIGFVLLAIGVPLLLVGLRQVQAARRYAAEHIVPELLELARRNSGLLTEAEVFARLGPRAVRALELLKDMANSGECRHELRGELMVFVFPELEPRLLMRRCPYCGHESSLSSAVSGERCPRCGADPRIGETRTDASSGDYRMDE